MADSIRVAELVRDQDLYPRSKLDTNNVSMLVSALQAGAQLPPVLADRNTLKLVDGFHRCAAFERLFGEDDAWVEVEWEDFPDDAAIFRESARRNVVHGKKLSSYDQDVCVGKAEALGITLERIAVDLSIPAEKLRRRVTLSGPVERMPGVFDAKPMALKRDFRHLEGQQFTQPQAEAHSKSNGAGVLYSARDVIRRIESGTVNWSHEGLVKTLVTLRDLLQDQENLHDIDSTV